MSKQEFEYDITNTEFIKKYKLLFSSIFARKQKYIFINMEEPSKAIFTNMPREELMVNVPSVDHTIHKVDFGEIDIVKMFNLYLPLDKLPGTCCCIDLTELKSLINKCETKEELLVVLHIDKIPGQFTVHKIKKVYKIPVDFEIPVVWHASIIEMQYLYDLISTTIAWVMGSSHTCDLVVDHTTLLKGALNFIDISNITSEAGTHIGVNRLIPFMDGFSTISTNEFYKKIPGDKIMILKAGQRGKTLRLFYHCDCDVATIYSVRPADFIFCNDNLHHTEETLNI